MTTQTEENFSVFQQNLKQFCIKTGSHLPSIIAVSKYQTAEHIHTLYRAGVRCFGENYVQEAADKKQAGAYGDAKLCLIGHLQSNKASLAVNTFDEIHSIDKIKRAKAIQTACEKANKTMPVMIQVNLAAEPQKQGCLIEELEALITYIYSTCSNLHLTGLMAIPPASENPSPYFQKLKHLCQTYDLPHCSIGMSGDWKEAVTRGATHIRVGTTLFGARG